MTDGKTFSFTDCGLGKPTPTLEDLLNGHRQAAEEAYRRAFDGTRESPRTDPTLTLKAVQESIATCAGACGIPKGPGLMSLSRVEQQFLFGSPGDILWVCFPC